MSAITIFRTLTNLGSGAVVDMLQTSDQGEVRARFLSRPSRITFALNCTGAVGGQEYVVEATDRLLVARSEVAVGATLGIMPLMNEVGLTVIAAAGEILSVTLRELGAVATTDFNLAMSITPIA